jgi:hypothetical protein
VYAYAALDLRNVSRNSKSKKGEVDDEAEIDFRTLYLFLHFVKDEIEQLVIPLQHARH